MAAQRAAARLAEPFSQSLQPLLWTNARGGPVCTSCMRRLQRITPFYTSSSRLIGTATARRPQSLQPSTPPRNVGIPDTSIAGVQPSVDDIRQLNTQRQQRASATEQAPTISIPEAEAQQSRPTSNSSTGDAVGSIASPEPSVTKSGRKSKLRPRKAAMTLSPRAVEQLKELLNQPDPKLIRVGVKNRGCSGLAYNLEYVEKPGAFDEAVEQDGVKVLVDSKALFSIIGSEMDWVEDKLSRRFVFKNPNITEQCGCGESFSIS